MDDFPVSYGKNPFEEESLLRLAFDSCSNPVNETYLFILCLLVI